MTSTPAAVASFEIHRLTLDHCGGIRGGMRGDGGVCGRGTQLMAVPRPSGRPGTAADGTMEHSKRGR